MRIAILSPEKSEFSSGASALAMGSGQDDAIRLTGPGVRPGHLRLTRDGRGYVLDVEADGTALYVNARPVRRHALLHPGDQLSLGANQVLLLGEHVREACPEEVAADAEVLPGTLVLRGVGGARSGQVLVVAPTLDLGADGLPVGPGRAPAPLRIQCVQGRPALLSGGLHGDALPRVNGHPAARAWLHDGDQITIGMQRYLVDAPEDAARHDAAHVFIPHEASRPEDTAGPRREVWWLLLTAAAIAMVMALLLALRH